MTRSRRCGKVWQGWLLGEMAPYLLFGFAMAGVLSVLISPEWTERHLGRRRTAARRGRRRCWASRCRCARAA